jgi:hypothetical protein
LSRFKFKVIFGENSITGIKSTEFDADFESDEKVARKLLKKVTGKWSF